MRAGRHPDADEVAGELDRCHRGWNRRRAGQFLNLAAGELRRLELSAREQAESLTLAYHHEFICEPAEFSDASSPRAVSGAVRRHLAGCRSCRREFDERVAIVLGEAGALELPLPP